MVQTPAMLPSRRLALAALAAAASVVSGADAPTGGASGPAIAWSETTHDFGTIPSDAKVSFAWPFKNVGSAPLEILATVPTCGCTASTPDGKTVAPGASGTLTVTFDPAGQNGNVRKSLAVVTNAADGKRTLLTIRAHVQAVDQPVAPGGHPPIGGQSLLIGTCGACHAAPGQGKSGRELYAAVCAMCHGDAALGGKAPSLRAPDYLASHDDKVLGEAIAYGTTNPKMPGFADAMGGPLDAQQIASLVKLLRTWGPAPAR